MTLASEPTQRAQRFGAPLAPVEHDGRLSWCVMLDLVPEGVAMWGVPWSMELALRTLHEQAAVRGEASRSFEDWMMTLPSDESMNLGDSFQETVNGVVAISTTSNAPEAEARVYLQRLHEQVAHRLGVADDRWAAPLVLPAAQRPARRFTSTMFVDEALVDRLEDHLRCTHRQVERCALIDTVDQGEPTALRARPRL